MNGLIVIKTFDIFLKVFFSLMLARILVHNLAELFFLHLQVSLENGHRMPKWRPKRLIWSKWIDMDTTATQKKKQKYEELKIITDWTMRLLRQRGLISFCVFGFWPDYYFTRPSSSAHSQSSIAPISLSAHTALRYLSINKTSASAMIEWTRRESSRNTQKSSSSSS